MSTYLGVCDLGDLFVVKTYDPADLTTGIKVDGVLTDPTTLTLEVQEPDGTLTAYTYAASQITKLNTGQFYRSHAVDQAGLHEIEWTGTGAATFSERAWFVVREGLP